MSAGAGRREAGGEAHICKHFTGIEIAERFARRRNGKKKINITSSIFIRCAAKAIPVWDYYKWILAVLRVFNSVFMIKGS